PVRTPCGRLRCGFRVPPCTPTLSAMRLIGARSITPRRKERTMKKRTHQALTTVLENLPAIITALATLVTAIAALVEKLN
ncbi:hypothetical protein NHH63_20505, partial [Xanthomonas campestris pv. campestris]|uniref:hypothetical protein n=1 Tax=Xanthomonas campestris TaxID=339 RepID=UPI00265B7683